MELEWDNGQYAGPVTTVTVGNCRRTGGIFYGTPDADPFDGVLTFAFAHFTSRSQLLRVLPRTTLPGKGNWVQHPAVREVNATWLRIHCHRPAPTHADGEIQSAGLQHLEYKVIPGRLLLLMRSDPSASDAPRESGNL
jgi:diacylglycerol kinase family enzyme